MRHVLVPVCVLLVTGCSSPEVERIQGRVLLDSEPIDQVSVCFWPRADIHLGIMVSYATDEDGYFDIKPRLEQGEGRAGEYKVMIQETDVARVYCPRFPRRYMNPTESPFEMVIPKGETQLDPFLMEKGKDFSPYADLMAIKKLAAPLPTCSRP